MLSEEFRQTHYLTGLLLHELKLAMNEQRDIRRCAINVLRNQLAKHAFDDRYASKVSLLEELFGLVLSFGSYGTVCVF